MDGERRIRERKESTDEFMQFQQCITSLKINCKDLMAVGVKVIVGVKVTVGVIMIVGVIAIAGVEIIVKVIVGVIVSVGMIEIVRVTAAVIAGVIVSRQCGPYL